MAHAHTDAYADADDEYDDPPTFINETGNKHYYFRGFRGRPTNPHLPSSIFPNGDQEWFYMGARHRPDGFAILHADGSGQYYIHDEQVDALPVVAPRVWPRVARNFDIPPEAMCIITYEPIDPASTTPLARCATCKAIFHLAAITTWVEINPVCPHCKTPWTSYAAYIVQVSNV